jgi:hypothetical protein
MECKSGIQLCLGCFLNLRWLLACCGLWLATGAFAQNATVTANLKQLGGGAAQPTGASIRVDLQNCVAPRVPGTGNIGEKTRTFYPNTSGIVTVTLFSNTVIDCGAGVPTGTPASFYTFNLISNGQVTSLGSYRVPPGASTLDTLISITTMPVVPSPTGDTTYLRLDLGNWSDLVQPLPPIATSSLTSPIVNSVFYSQPTDTIDSIENECSSLCTYVVTQPQTITLSADHTLSSNVQLEFLAGGEWTVNGAFQLTIPGSVSGPPTQHFAGTATVKFGLQAAVPAEWFGTAAPDTTALNQAIVAASPSSTALHFTPSTYTIDAAGLQLLYSQLSNQVGVSLEGKGSGEASTLDCSGVTGAACLTIQGNGDEGTSPYSRFHIDGLNFSGGNNSTAPNGILFDRGFEATFHDLTISNFNTPSGGAALRATNHFNFKDSGGNYSGAFPGNGGWDGIQVMSASPNCYNVSNYQLDNKLVQRFTNWGLNATQPSCNLLDTMDIHDSSFGSNLKGSIHVDGGTGVNAVHSVNLYSNHLEGAGHQNGATTPLYAPHIDLNNLIGANVSTNDIKDSTVGANFNAVKDAIVTGNVFYDSGAYNRPACSLGTITESGSIASATMTCTGTNNAMPPACNAPATSTGCQAIISGTTNYNGTFAFSVSGGVVSWTMSSTGLPSNASGTITYSPTAMIFTNGSSAFIAQNSVFSEWYGQPIEADDASARNLQFPAMTTVAESTWNGTYASLPKVYQNTFFHRYQNETFGGVQNPFAYQDSLYWTDPDGPNALHIMLSNRGYTEGSSAPSTGCYTAGALHRNTSPSAPTIAISLYGWLRLTTQTTSCTNTVGTDWLPLYTLTDPTVVPLKSGSPSVGHATCWKTTGTTPTLGYCSTAPDATGACTCN